jgi:hypothetical protein
MILRVSLLMLPLLAVAQGQQAPPEVDQELRARVDGFYQNFLETSYSPRKAETFVAEDTKDFFYNALKQKYLGYQILKITYDDNFAKAVVVVSSKMETTIGGQKVVADFPKDTHWKIENGKWCWTYDPADYCLTPMCGENPLKHPSQQITGPQAAAVIPKNSSPEEIRKAGKELLKQQDMGLDKGLVTFTADQPSSAQVVFTNSADGDITIALDGPVVRGLKAKLEKTTVPGHGTSILSFDYDPTDKSGSKDVWEPKGSIVFRVFAAPFDRIFPVSVQFIGK